MRIISFNVRGLSLANSKDYQSTIDNLNTIFSLFTPNIVILTESHNQIHNFKNTFKSIHSPNTFAGVSIYFMDESFKLLNSVIDEKGRFIFATISSAISEHPISLLAVYAPGKANTRSQWLCKEFPYNLKADIICGDFNISYEVKSRSQKYYPIQDRLFVNWINSNDFIDCAINFKNCNPTFYGTKSNSRIDRFYITNGLSNRIKEYKLITLPKRFDHRGILISLNETIKSSPKKQFIYSSRISKKYLSSEIIKCFSIHSHWPIIKNTISKSLPSNQLACLRDSKVMQTKSLILQNSININEFCSLKREIEAKISDLTQKHLSKRGLYLERTNEQPDKKLTALLKNNSKKYNIIELKHPKTLKCSNNINEMLKFSTEYYSDLFKLKSSCDNCFNKFFGQPMEKALSQVNSSYISEKFTIYEIKKTIKFSKSHSSPGPDGLSNEFYKDFSDLVVNPLNLFFNNLLDGKVGFPPQLKSGRVILLHKKGDRSDLNNYRPITLLNNDYKILSAVINKRILSFLNSIISPEQQGFVPSRSILHNPVILDFIMKTQSNYCIAFVDFSKAFDSVAHKAIFKSLFNFGFDSKSIKLIKMMIKNSSIDININGYISEQLKIHSGTKQGDPLSPTLFNLVIDHLSIRLSSLKGIQIGAKRFTHLFYADDLVIISSDPEDLKQGLLILKEFECASGLALNKNKSLVISTSPTDLLPIPSAPFEYLGFWFHTLGLEDKLYGIDKLIPLLEKWKFTSSQRAKAIIWKAYAASKLYHQQYLQPTPPYQVHQLRNLQSWFIWYSEKAYSNRTYTPKLSALRSSKEYWEGGLKLWETSARIEAQKASVFEWLLKSSNTTQHLLIQSINSSHISNSLFPSFQYDLFTSLAKSWFGFIKKTVKFHGKVNFKLFISDYLSKFPVPFKIKTIYESLAKSSTNLTEGQSKFSSTYHINFNLFWKSLYTSSIPIKGRDIIFKFFNNSLARSHNSICPFCNSTETRKHIFFDCTRLQPSLNNYLSEITSTLNIDNFVWADTSIMYLISRTKSKQNNQYLKIHKSIIATFFHFIWNSRCKTLKNQQFSPSSLVKITLYNIFNAINTAAEKLNSTIAKGYYYNKSKEKITLSPLDKQQMKNKFHLHWNTCKSFTLDRDGLYYPGK